MQTLTPYKIQILFLITFKWHFFCFDRALNTANQADQKTALSAACLVHCSLPASFTIDCSINGNCDAALILRKGYELFDRLLIVEVNVEFNSSLKLFYLVISVEKQKCLCPKALDSFFWR